MLQILHKHSESQSVSNDKFNCAQQTNYNASHRTWLSSHRLTDHCASEVAGRQARGRCTYMCFQVDGVAAFLEMLELSLAGVWVDGPDALHHLLRVLLHTA